MASQDSMLYMLRDAQLIALKQEPDKSDCLIRLCTLEDPKARPLCLSHKAWRAACENPSIRFESREQGDLLFLRYPASSYGQEGASQVVFAFSPGEIAIFCAAPQRFFGLLEELSREGGGWNVPRLLYHLLEVFIRHDSQRLDRLENRLEAMEDAVIEGKDHRDCVRSMIAMRRRLFALKRYYEQMADAFSGLLLNDSGLLEDGCAKYLRILTDRITRLHSRVMELQDYVTEIREAYQSQVDISLNRTMKFFTVITTIFLPLSLIAGWYGMNFDMPEYHLPFAYPALIGISLLVVGLTVFIFRKKKWF